MHEYIFTLFIYLFRKAYYLWAYQNRKTNAMHTFRNISDNEAAAIEAALVVLTASEDRDSRDAAQLLDLFINHGCESIGYGAISFINDAQIQGKRLQNALNSFCRKMEKNEALPADWFENDSH